MTFLESHRFFVSASRQWLGYHTWRTRLYFPIAYIRFMYHQFRDRHLYKQLEKDES